RPLLPDHRRGHVRLAHSAVARSRPQARPAAPYGEPGRRGRPPRQLPLGGHGQHRTAVPQPPGTRLGPRPVLLPIPVPQETPPPDARRPGSDISYRAAVEPWVGKPLDPPAAAARRVGDKTTVYASWNGATEVKSWRVKATTGGAPTTIASAAKSGFETGIPVKSGYKTFQVQALDASGRVIGTSKTVTATSG